MLGADTIGRSSSAANSSEGAAASTSSSNLFFIERDVLIKPCPEGVLLPTVNPRREEPVLGIEIDGRDRRRLEEQRFGASQRVGLSPLRWLRARFVDGPI